VDPEPPAGHHRLFPATTLAPPPWLLAAKACLLGLLVVGAAFPQVGGFAGKGMLFRLPLFFAPSLVLPGMWLARRRRAGDGEPPVRYQAALDAGLTLPFLADTAANAVGLYDSFEPTDNYLHAINWFILFGGVACALAVRLSRQVPSWLLVVAAGGIGAAGAIAWEIVEYRVMLAGPGNLHLTYPDTLSDLALSAIGGFLGAAAALWATGRRRPGRARTH